MSRRSQRTRGRHVNASKLAVAATGLATGVWGVGALTAGATAHRSAPGRPPADSPAEPVAAEAVTGAVAAASPDSITVQPPVTGATAPSPVSFALTSSTLVTLGASPASPAALAVGESVTVTPAAGAPPSAAGVAILLVRVTGTISAITNDSLTVTTPDGVSVNVDAAATTAVTIDGSPTAIPTLAVGDTVTAEGLVTPPGSETLDATAIAASTSPGGGVAVASSVPGLLDLGPGHGDGHAWGLLRHWFSASTPSLSFRGAPLDDHDGSRGGGGE